MSEDALNAKLDLILEEVRRNKAEARETHHDIYDKINTLEKKSARLEVIAGGGLFAAGVLLGTVIPKMFG